MKQDNHADGVHVAYEQRPSVIYNIPVGVNDDLDDCVCKEVETDTFNAFDLDLTKQDVIDLVWNFEFHKKTGQPFSSCNEKLKNKVMYALSHILSCAADTARDEFISDLEV